MIVTKIHPKSVSADRVLPAYDWAIQNRSKNKTLRTDAYSILNLDMLHYWLKLGTGILILDKNKRLPYGFPYAKVKQWVKTGKLKFERI